MARLFGTDGIRGIANTELTPELVYSIGFAHGYRLRSKMNGRPRVVVGRDTRISGALLESSYAAGLCAAGADAVILGVIPTPAVAWYVVHTRAQGGGVISASHNPAADNGIKLLGPQGFKLRDEEEDELEALARNTAVLERPSAGGVGNVFHCEREAEDAYVNYLLSLAEVRLDKLKLVVDCANGAAFRVAPRVFGELGAEITLLNTEPDGLTINRGCGSTHLELLQQKVTELGAQFGLAFDGDADRCLAVDEKGQVTDGDPLLLIFARHLRRQGRLDGSCVVTTVMANLGLEEALQRDNMTMARTGVGDRYVLAEMLQRGAKLGGEQSGHIIFLDHATTGDGVLTGLMLSQILAGENRPLSELASDCRKKPQLLVNVRVKDKNNWREAAEVDEAVRRIESALSGRGRLLVRPSGTENLLRLMAEGPDSGELAELLQELKSVLEIHCAPDAAGAKSGEAPDFAACALSLDKMAAHLKKTKAAVTKLAKVSDWDSTLAAAGQVAGLAQEFASWAADGRRQAAAWEKHVQNERLNMQRAFSAELREEAQKCGMEMSTITLSPPEYRLGRFTVLLNLSTGKAEIQYCRMTAAETGLNAAAVSAAVRALEAQLDGADFSAEKCFADMLKAYKRRLIWEGKALGERVNLVDLVPEMAFQQQLAGAKVKKRSLDKRPYDKIQFAWDLLRTWRELHGLECHGRRLNLGTATINATKNKQSVLFLDEGGTHGQYYLSVWFTK